MSRRFGLLIVLALAAPASVVLALAIGSVDIGWADVARVLTGAGDGLARTVILDLRLPRALNAFAVGGLLALAGALLQVLLRNPLADPYVLGISGGAASAALAALALGLGTAGVSGSAFVGALVSMALVFGLSRARGTWTPTRLLLTGVVVAAGWGALISLMLALAPDRHLYGMLFWLMGDLSRGGPSWPGLLVLLAALLACLPLGRPLNLLARGDLNAAALGADVARLRAGIYFLASLLTAAAVTVAGSIGFVGLIVPHLLRLLGGNDHRTLLPNAALLGGSFLVLADALARTVAAPQQLPVGVITALLGVPVFLILLQRAHAG